MKIAIPTSENKLDPHFGHCALFTMIDIDETSKTILGTEEIPAPPHEPGALPVWLAEKGVQLVIAGGMGQRAIMLLNEKHIDVILGAPPESPESIAKAFLDGGLQEGENSCDH